ncbi:MAG: SpoIIE family protein phosphatase [Leptospiraceae bacterium]|nr:SpoIIE family protein phosphatase [Leptospiraceae bacterium]
MDFIDLITSYTLFNFYSFGTLLVSFFTFFFAFFFLNLSNKSKSTFHLGMGFFFLALFSFGYFFGASFYHPLAAYHRWLTGGFVLPALIHFGQFFFTYPTDINPKLSRRVFQGSWAIAILAILTFFYQTAISEKKYHFTGHYWDFDAEGISFVLGIIIMLFSLVKLLVIGLWKAYRVKTNERYVILLMVIAMFISALLPNFTNILSRDGALERSTYLFSLVFSFVLGFFMVSIVYINSTTDRTSFMAKIISITLVTMLLIMQSLSFYTMKDQDSDFDGIKVEHIERILINKDYFRDIDYILEIPLDSKEINKIRYSDVHNLDLELLKIDFLNTSIHDRIQRLTSTNFKKNLIEILDTTHPYFQGYRESIDLFLQNNESLSDSELKDRLSDYLSDLNSIGYVTTNRISALNNTNFCSEVTKFLSSKLELKPFKNEIERHFKDCEWDNKPMTSDEMRREINKYFRFFKPSLTRHYRKSMHEYQDQQHYVSYIYYNPYLEIVTEVGFSYIEYRNHIHKVAYSQQLTLIIVILVIVIFYPMFFRGSLLNPLNLLLQGVENVNNGELEVEVPVMVKDEIGFLADSFNKMVISIRYARSELQHYAETLEEKVANRTKEVEEQMSEVQNLKNQQDGDYYLTSLLAKPLFKNWNKSDFVSTDFFLKQKKSFQFRTKESELGGDICVTGNLRLGKKEKFKRYTFALNGDAMGKSMQGAGGSLVMGVVINSIIARSARNDWVLDQTPEHWLTEMYYEVNRVFKSFNGSMVISCVAMLIDDETGDTFYFNAEHPFSVLYRNGDAVFIDKDLTLRKLGLDSEIPFEVQKTKLLPGDILIIGSDGRDDIDLTPEEPFRTINEDENLFLKHVVRGKGNLEEIYKSILKMGSITDDFSLLRVVYREHEISNNVDLEDSYDENIEIDSIYQKCKEILKAGNFSEAYEHLNRAYQINPDHPKVSRLYGMLAFKSKDFHTAISVMRGYLLRDPLYSDFWYYLGISEKMVGNYRGAEEASRQLVRMQPDHIQNMINLTDILRLQNKLDEARVFLKQVINIDPENRQAKKMFNILEKNNSNEDMDSIAD